MMERNNEEERRKEPRKNRFEMYTKHTKVNKQTNKKKYINIPTVIGYDEEEQ